MRTPEQVRVQLIADGFVTPVEAIPYDHDNGGFMPPWMVDKLRASYIKQGLLKPRVPQRRVYALQVASSDSEVSGTGSGGEDESRDFRPMDGGDAERKAARADRYRQKFQRHRKEWSH